MLPRVPFTIRTYRGLPTRKTALNQDTGFDALPTQSPPNRRGRGRPPGALNSPAVEAAAVQILREKVEEEQSKTKAYVNATAKALSDKKLVQAQLAAMQMQQESMQAQMAQMLSIMRQQMSAPTEQQKIEAARVSVAQVQVQENRGAVSSVKQVHGQGGVIPKFWIYNEKIGNLSLHMFDKLPSDPDLMLYIPPVSMPMTDDNKHLHIQNCKNRIYTKPISSTIISEPLQTELVSVDDSVVANSSLGIGGGEDV